MFVPRILSEVEGWWERRINGAAYANRSLVPTGSGYGGCSIDPSPHPPDRPAQDYVRGFTSSNHSIVDSAAPCGLARARCRA